MVYIVDDNASVVDALSSLLRANGKQVQMFTSGQEFLDFPREDSCACLILDLRLPGMNGLQVQNLIAPNVRHSNTDPMGTTGITAMAALR
jgi:FixJ family two-component response regulator